MALSPIARSTLQAALISAISNILAQFIAAHQAGQPFAFNPIPTLQYTLYALLSTPPNFMWQEYLESIFPSYTSQEDGDNKSEIKRMQEQPRLNKINTLIKTILDQTLAAVLNNLAFCLALGGMRMGMAKQASEFLRLQQQHHSQNQSPAGSFILSLLLLLEAFSKTGGPMRYEDVNWAVVWEQAKSELWGLMIVSWQFWPLVSVVNYAFLTSVEARTLIGSLAGLAWGVYLSLYAGGN